MSAIQFLAEWTLRSSILILSGWLLLRLLRLKDPSIRLAAWTAVLCGSLAIPVLTEALPKVPVAVAIRTAVVSVTSHAPGFQEAPPAVLSTVAPPHEAFDWARAALVIYILVAGMLLLRLVIGLAISHRILRRSIATSRMMEGTEVRESDQVTAPVTLGVVRSAIVLPADWREWDDTKLDAVLAHERSHIRRRDPAVQLLSAIHRALGWHNPLSWFLHRNLVRVAEEASDDAAVANCDRASYAEILLEFMSRGVRPVSWQGVAMARYGRADERIERILDGAATSRGITRWSLAAILALACPLAYLAAAAYPQAPVLAAAPQAPEAPALPEAPAGSQAATAPRAPQAPQAPAAPAAPAPLPQRNNTAIRQYMIVMGDSVNIGSMNSNVSVDAEGLRAKYGSEFAWFRENGNTYVVTNDGVLEELEKAMEPQMRVNQMQHVVNDLQQQVNLHQADVNRAQSEVNAHQNDVNALQNQMNRRQDLLNKLQNARSDDELIQKLTAALDELRAKKGGPSSQDAVNREEDKVNQLQHHVNELQSQVNDEQHKVNAEQSRVNAEQQRVSAEFNGRIEEILDSAVRRGLVQQLN